MRRSVFFLSFFCFLCLQILDLNAGTHRELFEKTLPLKPGGELFLDNINGKIEIEVWDQQNVRIEAEKIVKGVSSRDAEAVMEKVEIKIRNSDDKIIIETDYPKRSNGFWSFLFGNNWSIEVSYRLLVPRSVQLDLHTVNGKVIISDVEGNIKTETTNGGIRVVDASGSVKAKTTNGSIEIDLHNYSESEDMSFKTTNGSITVSLPQTFQGEIEARTVNGSIRTDFPIALQGKISRRSLRGEINGGGSLVSLRTANGSIRILEN